jgi:hypothetical protein
MRLIVDGTAGLVTVDDAEDLKALSVELRGCSPRQASALLADLGRVEGSHAWLHIGALRAFVPQPRSCGWDERFQQAMAYAEQHGWTDQTGNFVRAHIASPPGDTGPQARPQPASNQES